MGWSGLVGSIGDVHDLASRTDDDWFDRLNHRWTGAQLLVFALLVSTKQYVGEPITCWVPKHFTGAWEDYTNSYCWVRNTYYLRWEDDRDHLGQDLDEAPPQRHPIIYYQWVPLILMVQALLFHFPISIWRFLSERTGVDLCDMVDTAERYQHAQNPMLRRKVMTIMGRQLDRYLARSWVPGGDGEGGSDSCYADIKWIVSKMGCCCACGTKFGNYMTLLYLGVKLLFLANAVGQLWMLTVFLGQDYTMYGVEIVEAIYGGGHNWSGSHRFPRVTLCDFNVRRLGSVHSYTVQCVLSINIFNEKIYLYLWFWFVFLSLVTAWGLVKWLVRLTVMPHRYQYVVQQLHPLPLEKFDPGKASDRRLLYYFIRSYLRQDGYLVVKMVDLNTNKVTSSDLLCAIWENFLDKPDIHRDRMGTDEDV